MENRGNGVVLDVLVLSLVILSSLTHQLQQQNGIWPLVAKSTGQGAFLVLAFLFLKRKSNFISKELDLGEQLTIRLILIGDENNIKYEHELLNKV